MYIQTIGITLSNINCRSLTKKSQAIIGIAKYIYC